MNTTSATETVTQAECWSILGRHDVGRLAVDIAGRPDIFPINYVVDGESIVFKTGAGTKFAGAVLGRHVAFEIDGSERDNRTVWSVVVKGIAHELDNMYDRFEADDLPLYPWVAELKPNYVRIEPGLVTGRRFHVVDEAQLEPDGDRPDHHPGEPRLRPD